MSNFLNAAAHAIAGMVIFGATLFFMGVPADIQAMTVAGVVTLALKWAHLVYGA